MPTFNESTLEKIESAVRQILTAVGEDPSREGLSDTPKRVAKMYLELLDGINDTPERHLEVIFEADHDEMVMVKNISFSSLCEHHLVPFMGKAHVAYIPNDMGKITGLSKLARLVEGYSKRLQVQERLTSQIANAIDKVLAPKGVLVVIEAEHMCMSIRGVKKPGSVTVTSAVRGIFRTDVSTRFEAMNLIKD